MGYLPILVEMTARPCLVVGGGAVAERKVEALLEVGASVTIVSPLLTERLESRVTEGAVRHVPRAYRPGDLVGHALAFVATHDRTLNAQVFRDARARGVWVNASDDPAHCDFILPSVVRRGDLTIAVATGGTSPALSRAVREELEAYLPDHYATLVQVVGEVRRELRLRACVPGPDEWHAALGADLRRLIAEGQRDAAKTYLLTRLGSDRCA
jgi:siroheme synthase-like protein